MERLRHVQEFLVSKDRTILSNLEMGKPLTTVLEEYFKSKKCIEFDHKQNRMKLHFDIFLGRQDTLYTQNGLNNGDAVVIQIDASEQDYLNDHDVKNDYWFLECLANEKVLSSLCKHPYVTAFLDIHYSTMEKARSQMKDSVPHLALSLLLLVLVSTMPGPLHNNEDTVLILSSMLCFVVFTLDLLSLIALSTPIFDCWLRGSLVRNHRNVHCSPKEKATTYENCIYLFFHLIHILGYVLCVTTLIFGYTFHQTVEHRKEDFTLDKCTQNEELTTWKMIEISLIFYPLLLLLVELIKMKTAKTLREYFERKKTWIDFVEIIISLIIALESRHSHQNICEYPWIPNLILIVSLLSFSQLIDDIVDSIPNNDIVQVDMYRHIFYRVARTYLVIMAGFLPFLVAFAFCFQGRNQLITQQQT